MKEKEISIRGKTSKICYVVVDNGGLVYARVTWENGKDTFFYKGMYNEGEWFAKDVPSDLIQLLSPLFDTEIPVRAEPETNHGKVPK